MLEREFCRHVKGGKVARFFDHLSAFNDDAVATHHVLFKYKYFFPAAHGRVHLLGPTAGLLFGAAHVGKTHIGVHVAVPVVLGRRLAHIAHARIHLNVGRQ